MASSRISSLLRVGLILLTLAILLATVAATLRHNTSSNDRSKLLTTATFVGRDSCKSCHESATAAWTGSHHDMAMDHATEQTVLGDFNAATFEQAGLVTRFFRRDGQFIVNTQGPDGQLHDYVVSYVFGFTPLQQYLIEFPGGRYQCLTIAWDTVKRKWYSLYPGENIPPGDPLHWTGRLQNWNRMCAQCHSTDVRKNYDIASGSYHTTWKEIDVSCEACHGPASHHVQWANASSLRRLFMGDNPRLVTDLKTSAAAQLDACFVCHSRRRTITDSYRHGEPWTDHFVPELLEANTYHADGQILDEVYEFGSYTQSLMYHRNIRCSDCHDPHSLRPLAAVDNNSLCIRCHEPAKFNSDAHLRHAPGTPGSRCIDCHMPTKTYMGVDVRRDHSIRIPRPDLTVQLGTPNACNQCHTDKTPQWAADHVVAWFGPVRRHPPDRPDDWAPAIAAARANTPDSLDKLLTMLADDRLPVIVRATGPPSFGHSLIPTRWSDLSPLRRAAVSIPMSRSPTSCRCSMILPAWSASR
jgi:predicted CXXCH cytochrome family protein